MDEFAPLLAAIVGLFIQKSVQLFLGNSLGTLVEALGSNLSMCLFSRQNVVLPLNASRVGLLELADLPYVVLATASCRKIVDVGKLFNQLPKLIDLLLQVSFFFLQVPVLLL